MQENHKYVPYIKHVDPIHRVELFELKPFLSIRGNDKSIPQRSNVWGAISCSDGRQQNKQNLALGKYFLSFAFQESNISK